MNELQVVALLFGVLLLILLSGIWIGVGIGLVGAVAVAIFTRYPVGDIDVPHP